MIAAIWLAASSGGAHATLIFTLTSTSCAGCGSGPWGTVAVDQDPSGTQAIDFTITLNAPYEFHKTLNPQHPVFAVDLNVLNVKFSNFKLNNTATTKVTSAGASGNVPNYGGFPYTLSASSNLVGVLTFTASVTTGTLLPTNVVSNGKAYTVIDIMTLSGTATGNVAAVNPPVHTPEPAGISLLILGIAGIEVMRRAGLRRA